MTPGLLKSIKHCKLMYKKTLHKNCEKEMKEEYKCYSTLLKRVKRSAKRLYYSKVCTEFKSNTKKLWKVINDVSGKTNDKSCLIDSLKIDNILECNGKKISNAFGKYFSNVGEKFAKKIPSPKKGINEYLRAIRQNNLSLFFSPCTRTELKKMIKKLPSKNSSGHDNVSNTLLKEISDTIIDPLITIFNQSLALGVFPTIMKIADIVPLHKGKERYLETNYRPISLLTTISKLLEKVVCTRVYNFLDNTGQIVSTQYGFRENHSCEQAISHLVGNIIKNTENKQVTVSLFLDLSKAFDTLEHNIVLEKMRRYGIRGTCLAWFESYLTDRKMRVKCTPTSMGSTILSDLYNVSYGAPQGSCLGPLIF